MAISPETIATLSTTPPPTRFLSARAAAARIGELELSLGLPRTKPSVRLEEFNRRIAELEAMKIAADKRLPQRTQSSPTAKLTLKEVTALHELIFGKPKTDATIQNAAAHDFGAKEMATANKWLADFRLTPEGRARGPKYEAALRVRAGVAKEIAAKKAGSDTDKLFRLTANFVAAGISVPGLDMSGHAIPVAGSADAFTPRQADFANRQITDFLAAIRMENLSVLSGFGPVANAAKDFLREAGKLDDRNRIINL